MLFNIWRTCCTYSVSVQTEDISFWQNYFNLSGVAAALLPLAMSRMRVLNTPEPIKIHVAHPILISNQSACQPLWLTGRMTNRAEFKNHKIPFMISHISLHLYTGKQFSRSVFRKDTDGDVFLHCLKTMWPLINTFNAILCHLSLHDRRHYQNNFFILPHKWTKWVATLTLSNRLIKNDLVLTWPMANKKKRDRLYNIRRKRIIAGF